MVAKTALLGYRERVAQEKQRIASHVLSLAPAEREHWDKVRFTQRLPLGKSQRLVAQAVNGKKLYAVSAREVSFDFAEGLTLTLVKSTPDTEIFLKSFKVGRDPVHIGEDVFVAIDTVDPFGGSEESIKLNLIVYSSAGTEGAWSEGTAISAEDETNT